MIKTRNKNEIFYLMALTTPKCKPSLNKPLQSTQFHHHLLVDRFLASNIGKTIYTITARRGVIDTRLLVIGFSMVFIRIIIFYLHKLGRNRWHLP